MTTTKELLAEWQAKARCDHTQDAATRLWRELTLRLSAEHRSALRIAWSHSTLGEGNTELDREYLRVMAEISA